MMNLKKLLIYWSTKKNQENWPQIMKKTWKTRENSSEIWKKQLKIMKICKKLINIRKKKKIHEKSKKYAAKWWKLKRNMK